MAKQAQTSTSHTSRPNIAAPPPTKPLCVLVNSGRVQWPHPVRFTRWEHSIQQLLPNPIDWTESIRMQHGRTVPVTMPFLSSAYSCAYWLRDQTFDRIRRACLAVLRAGPIPQHVAFVMDGNRRYARINGMKVIQGHVDGFVALRRVLEICSSLDIKFVSVYAFAIDNFKRPKEEVDGLMHLAENALLDLCTRGGLLAQHGVRLNTVGKTNLFPPEVQAALAKAEELTKDNHRAVLNLCMPYSSRDEIATAVEETIHVALLEGRTEPITEKDIEDHLMTTKVNSPPLDILIRTSGVRRLSDFLLWQCTDNTQIHFIDTFWPDMGLFDLLPIMLDYQRKIWSQ